MTYRRLLPLLVLTASCGRPRPPFPAPGTDAVLCKTGTLCFAYGAAIEVRATSDTRSAAERFYRRACALDEPRGCNALAVLLVDHGIPGAHVAEAADLFAVACEARIAGACTNLALLAEAERHGAGTGETLRRFAAACDAGSVGACRRLAAAYATGDGVPRDPARADVLFDLACAGNDIGACADLGRMLARGMRPADLPRSMAYSSRACMASRDVACDWLAATFEVGHDAVRDAMRAASLYARTCARGSVLGCLGLARMRRRGEGAHVDVDSAQRWIGDACSKNGGAVCEAEADLVIADENTALDAPEVGRLLGAACDGSNAVACGRLGEMVLVGVGVEVDEARGRSLLARACQGGITGICDDCSAPSTCRLDDELASSDGLRDSLRRIADAWLPDCEPPDGIVCPPRGWAWAPLAARTEWERDIDLFHRSCEAGVAESCARLDARFAVRLAEEHCGDGDLADCLFAAEGHGHDAAGPGGAVLFFEKACELQHGLSCARVGWWYADAENGGHDLVRGIELLRTACGLEVELACAKLEELSATP
ncbi:MAG: hypothetical protein V3T05_08345 [Myxococcota bacterium]